MMRLTALGLLLVVTGLPLSGPPSPPPVAWLAAAALAVGGAGVIAWSVPLVTAAGSLALIAYALGLVVAGPVAEPAAPIALGVTLVLLLALTHFGGRARGASRGPAVIAALVRQWLAVAALGAAVAVGLIAAAVPLGAALASASLPAVITLAALGALVTVAGLVALVVGRGPRS